MSKSALRVFAGIVVFLGLSAASRAIAAPTLKLSPTSLDLTAGSNGLIVASLSEPAPFTFDISLSTSNRAIVGAPLSATFATGSDVVVITLNALAAGTATITARMPSSLGGSTATAAVRVTSSATVSLSPSVQSIRNGDTGTLTIRVSGTIDGAATVTLTSSNTSVATVPSPVTVPVGPSGYDVTVTSVGPGTSTITARLQVAGAAGPATATVTVTQGPAVTLSPQTLAVAPGASGTMTARLKSSPNGAPVGETLIRLTSSNVNVATVQTIVSLKPDEDGVSFPVFGITAGTATITATLPESLGGGSGTASVVVGGGPLLSITLTPPSLSIIAGTARSLTATIGTAQAIDTPVSLASLNPEVVSVVAASVSIAAGATTASITIMGIKAGTATITATLPASLGGAAATASVTVLACTPPSAPMFLSPPATLTAGQTTLLSWTAPPGTFFYRLETSRDGFVTAEEIVTSATSAVVRAPRTGSDYTLSARVTASGGCAPSSVSTPASIAVKAAPASFAITKTGPSWTTSKGVAPGSATVTFRNTGETAGRLTLLVSGGLFDVSAALLDLAPGSDGSVTLMPTPLALGTAGGYAGLLRATSSADSLSTPVLLTVTPLPVAPGSNAGAKVSASPSRIVFSAPAGQTPGPKTLTLSVASGDAISLAPSIGPGGAWLSMSSDLAAPVRGSTSLTLFVDRTKRSPSDGPAPLRTFLVIAPVGGDPLADAAVIEVLDVDAPSPAAGSGRTTPPPGGTSLIVPTAVRIDGVNSSFSSDGWLRNADSRSAAAEFFLTLDGKNGLTDSSVVKSSLSIPGNQTMRLADLVGSVFGADGVSGEVEVRSPSIAAFSLRATVDSIQGGDPASRFGTEIPTATYRNGLGSEGDETIIPGIDEDDTNRANLVLAEVAGASATARVSVNDANGSELGAMTVDVPPYGKVQLNRVVTAIRPGITLSSGFLGVTVTEGSGRVVALATVIDNRSGSFSAVGGRTLPGPNGPQPAECGTPACHDYVIPSAVRTVGAFNTSFITRLSLTNGGSKTANLVLTYRYVDQDDGGAVKSIQSPLVLPPRSSLPKSLGGDIVRTVFGVTSRSFGSIVVRGDTASVTGVAAISAQVDPSDASKGLKTAPIEGVFGGVFGGAVGFTGLAAAPRFFAGAEKSAVKRTNLVLLETSGGEASVRVTATSSAGQLLGAKTFTVAASQYFQINDVFGPNGLGIGDGPFQNVTLTVEVASGGGTILPFATVNDNVSRNPEIFVLR